VEVHWKAAGRTFDLTIALPPGIAADVWMPGAAKATPAASGRTHLAATR
jgi:hypothetical protein